MRALLRGTQVAGWCHREAVVRVKGQGTGLAQVHADHLAWGLVQMEL